MSAIDHTAYFALALALAKRPHPQPQPAAVVAVGAGDADLLLLALAFARRLEQTKHRLRHVGIADEDPLHRAHVRRGRSPRERKIGRIEIDDMTARVGDREAVMGMIGDAARHRIVGAAIGETNDAGSESEQAEQPDRRQQRQQAEDIGLRLGAADGHQGERCRDNAAGHQQHQDDAAAAPHRFMRGHRLP